MEQQQIVGTEALQEILEELKGREDGLAASIPSQATVETCESVIDELL